MTRAEAAASLRPGLREKMCILKDPDGRYYHRSGNNNNRENAELLTVAKAIAPGFAPEDWIIEVLNSESLAKEPPSRKFAFEEALPKTLIELAKIAPTNEALHGHLMAIFGRKPPVEAITYQAIKDWAEFNFHKPNIAAPKSGDTRARPANEGIRLEVEISELEIGTASYSVRRSMVPTVSISAATIRDIVSDSGDFQEILSAVMAEAEEEAWDYDDGGGHGDFEYEVIEPTDSEDRESTVLDRRSASAALAGWLRSHFTPEDCEEMEVPE